jgi:hypothetical protein
MGRLVTTVLLLLFVFTFVSSPVFAVKENYGQTKEKVNQGVNRYSKTSEYTSSSMSAKAKEFALAENPKAVATLGAKKIQKLSEVRLKKCEAKEEAISERFKNMQMLGLKLHQDRVNLVIRVDKYYNEKLVPAGYTLNNYEALKTDITTKEANLQAAIVKLQQSGQTFSCDLEDPKATTDVFRANVQALIMAHKEYKTATKNFIVAVKGLSKQAILAKLSPSPVISQVPNVTQAPVVSPVPTGE